MFAEVNDRIARDLLWERLSTNSHTEGILLCLLLWRNDFDILRQTFRAGWESIHNIILNCNSFVHFHTINGLRVVQMRALTFSLPFIPYEQYRTNGECVKDRNEERLWKDMRAREREHVTLVFRKNAQWFSHANNGFKRMKIDKMKNNHSKYTHSHIYNNNHNTLCDLRWLPACVLWAHRAQHRAHTKVKNKLVEIDRNVANSFYSCQFKMVETFVIVPPNGIVDRQLRELLQRFSYVIQCFVVWWAREHF